MLDGEVLSKTFSFLLDESNKGFSIKTDFSETEFLIKAVFIIYIYIYIYNFKGQ